MKSSETFFCILFDMEKHLQQAGSNFREWSVSRTHIVHYYQMVNRFFFFALYWQLFSFLWLRWLLSFGRAGVECYCQHESGAAVIQLQFLINEVCCHYLFLVSLFGFLSSSSPPSHHPNIHVPTSWYCRHWWLLNIYRPRITASCVNCAFREHID